MIELKDVTKEYSKGFFVFFGFFFFFVIRQVNTYQIDHEGAGAYIRYYCCERT